MEQLDNEVKNQTEVLEHKAHDTNIVNVQNDEPLKNINQKSSDIEINNTSTEINDKKAPYIKKFKKPSVNPNKNNSNQSNRKEHNGFLRNNNNNKNKLHHTNKSKFNKPKPSFNYNENEVEQTPTILSKEKELLFSLRNKIGFSMERFVSELQNTLKEFSFSDIKENEMDLLTYSILYSKEEVFLYLLNNYSAEFNKLNIEKYISNYSINKNPLFIKELISVYDSKYKGDDSFIKNLISKVCKTSYRFENNQEFLNWFEANLNNDNKDFFWKECIKEKNVVLFEHALTFKDLISYLRSNYTDFEEKINLFGKKHTVQKALSGNISYVHPVKESELNVASFVTKEVIAEINEDFLPKVKDKKEINQTEVIIKKKRKIS